MTVVNGESLYSSLDPVHAGADNMEADNMEAENREAENREAENREAENGERWVEVSFDCLPLRSVPRLDIPIDASPKYRERCERIKAAIEKHGAHNSFYLYNARCVYHLANSNRVGTVEFAFEGTALTDADDLKCTHCDLDVALVRETVDWLTEPISQWFAQTVPRTTAVEFDRYIDAGDLEKTRQRIEQLQTSSDEAGGFVGMYL